MEVPGPPEWEKRVVVLLTYERGVRGITYDVSQRFLRGVQLPLRVRYGALRFLEIWFWLDA